jgi:predicted SprT family Zn-dependent metalloprotease
MQPYELDIPVSWLSMPSRDDYLAAKLRAWQRCCHDAPSESAAHVVIRPAHSERPHVSPAPLAVYSLAQRWNYFRDLAAREIEWHGLTQRAWRVKYNHSRTCAGECDMRAKTLSFSRHLIARGPLKELRNTLLHEIAHALAGARHDHDQTWRSIALKIGCDGERCYNFELAPHKWLFRCSAGCWQTRRHRRHSIDTKQTCRKCNAACIYVRI